MTVLTKNQLKTNYGYGQKPHDFDDFVDTVTDVTVLGIENVDNTSDANKPVSTATQTALDKKQVVIQFIDLAALNSAIAANPGWITGQEIRVLSEPAGFTRIWNGTNALTVAIPNDSTITLAASSNTILATSGAASGGTTNDYVWNKESGVLYGPVATTQSKSTSLFSGKKRNVVSERFRNGRDNNVPLTLLSSMSDSSFINNSGASGTLTKSYVDSESSVLCARCELNVGQTNMPLVWSTISLVSAIGQFFEFDYKINNVENGFTPYFVVYLSTSGSGLTKHFLQTIFQNNTHSPGWNTVRFKIDDMTVVGGAAIGETINYVLIRVYHSNSSTNIDTILIKDFRYGGKCKPKFIVTLDDANTTDYSVAYNYLKDKGYAFRFCSAIIKDRVIANQGYTVAQLKEMYADGVTFLAHGYNQYTGMTISDVNNEINNTNQYLIDNGVREGHNNILVYPGGSVNQSLICNFSSIGISMGFVYGAVSLNGDRNMLGSQFPCEKYVLGRVRCGATQYPVANGISTNVAAIKTICDKTVSDGGVTILGFHALYPTGSGSISGDNQDENVFYGVMDFLQGYINAGTADVISALELSEYFQFGL